jgi:hypothetical protein
LDSYVGLHREEEEEGLMPYSFSMPKASNKQQMPVLEESVVQSIKHQQKYISNL